MKTAHVFPVIVLVFLVSGLDALGSTSTIAIIHGSNMVCGILAGVSPQTISCVSENSQSFSVSPNRTMDSISGGRDFFCGVTSAGPNSLFCWNLNENTTSSATRYGGEAVLNRRRLFFSRSETVEDVSVGETQVSAMRNGSSIEWWRSGSTFPNRVEGKYTSLTSGNGFTCAIGANDSRVRCWGNGIGGNIEQNYSSFAMSTIVAGDSHVCGISTNGSLICKGNDEFRQLGTGLEFSPFEFSGLAMGERHSCGIRTANNTVVCWGNGQGWYNPMGDVSVELIVSGGNLTCGLISQNFSVLCWGLPFSSSPPAPTLFDLPKVLPGLCRRSESSCSCGVISDSQQQCSSNGVICRSCPRPPPASSPEIPPESPPEIPPESPPESPPEESDGDSLHKGLLAFAIVGSVGTLIGICTIVYLVVTRICNRKKVHNSVLPTITNGNSSGSRKTGDSPPTTATSLRNQSNSIKYSRSKSTFFNRQRSGTSSGILTERTKQFTFEDLSEATKNFSPDATIGRGSFGTVYRGVLSDGREVAIKRSEIFKKGKRIFQEQESAFLSELEFLSRLHHKHLVSFVGSCEDSDERLLVYEYMKNGALYDHLHRNTTTTTSKIFDSWKIRIKILLDAARGVDYLHNYAVPPIIHRDIKSSNILLDANWTAKVSDFGLSLSGPVSEGTHLCTKAAGTLGYMDPEYYGLHHLTTKSDVYGLGVVILEMLTGKRAIFKDEDGTPTSVVEYAVPKMVSMAGGNGGGLVEVLDRRIGEATAAEKEALELVAYTAMHCVKLEGKDRPDVADVVVNLEAALGFCEEISQVGTDSGDRSSELASCD